MASIWLKLIVTSRNKIHQQLCNLEKLFFNNGEPWVIKVGNEEFDVPMGCFDGPEICEMVGIYNLRQFKNVIRKENAVLYRDDGLGILRNLSYREIERLRERIIKVFKD